MNKHSRTPHKPTNTRERDLLRLIHMEVCGPMEVESLGGAEYFASFVDDETRYSESEVP